LLLLHHVLLQHHTELAAAERTAADALDAERARSSQLQQQLAELTASSAEQQRALEAQLHDAKQQLAARGDEVAVLTTQLQQAQEGLTARAADISRLQAELSQVIRTTGCHINAELFCVVVGVCSRWACQACKVTFACIPAAFCCSSHVV
jgi:DNA repair exonuclease SbcCD ATPase subunit